MEYKRTNKTLKSNIEYIETNNQGIYINTSVEGANFAPYHGLYINSSPKNDEIYLSKMIELLEINHIKYNIMDIKTSEMEYGGKEFLKSFNTEPVPTYTYEFDGCIMEKKYKLHPEEKILCIDYKITNNTGKVVKFIASPCVTKRTLNTLKRMSELKFTTQVTSNAVKVALSISENLNLYLKSNNLKYNKKENYINGVNYDYEIGENNIKTYVEDLFVPGCFETSIKSGITNTYSIYVALEDVDVKPYKSLDIEMDIKARDDMRLGFIDEKYFELKELAKTAYKLHYIDKNKRQLVLTESIPAFYDNDEYVKNMIISIEGNYLLLKRYKEAHKILESMMLKLKDTTYKLSNLDRCEAMLLFIEALNRYLMHTEANIEEIRTFYEYIKENIYDVLDRKNKEVFADQEFLLVVDNKRYIKLNSLWYNALRIFVDLADKFKEESEFIYTISESLRENIREKFWDDNNNVLKYELEEESFASVDMLYALSLSYPVLKDTNISMKLMDTAFKTIYTAYGLRLAETKSRLYDGFVYPHLMVHFLKANLRQMGVTRASQKLAYNLIKEIFLDIGKQEIGTVPFRYFEKTKKPYVGGISAITNGELIRAFEMLT